MKKLTDSQKEIYNNWKNFVKKIMNGASYMSDEQLLYFFRKSRDACICTDDAIDDDWEICVTIDYDGVGMAMFFPVSHPDNTDIINEIITLRQTLFIALCREVVDRGLGEYPFGKF